MQCTVFHSYPNIPVQELTSYPGSWWVGVKKTLYLLFRCVCNYPLLNVFKNSCYVDGIAV